MMAEESARGSVDRRKFIESSAMASGLAAGYGTLGFMAVRFLHAGDGDAIGWQFLCRTDELSIGESLPYITPSGAKVVVARQSEGNSADDFVALSSVCPHLGCAVHWESQNDRFFCPCHNGAFDPQGNPTEGPPAAAGQQLSRFPLLVENGLLFIEVPLRSVLDTGTQVASVPKPSRHNGSEQVEA
ncbi:MAG: Rieske (2Fe-2S) protein [Planctomycetaceae bacterium]|nr:Rieske (2Fe-2S) protein [Planctomycetales bacterium]MCB9923499.1 Rieske (2Fe-2S) protein [Planctomycetaceae bacterium]